MYNAFEDEVIGTDMDEKYAKDALDGVTDHENEDENDADEGEDANEEKKMT